jgi:hypothetical protein
MLQITKTFLIGTHSKLNIQDDFMANCNSQLAPAVHTSDLLTLSVIGKPQTDSYRIHERRTAVACMMRWWTITFTWRKNSIWQRRDKGIALRMTNLNSCRASKLKRIPSLATLPAKSGGGGHILNISMHKMQKLFSTLSIPCTTTWRHCDPKAHHYRNCKLQLSWIVAAALRWQWHFRGRNKRTTMARERRSGDSDGSYRCWSAGKRQRPLAEKCIRWN